MATIQDAGRKIKRFAEEGIGEWGIPALVMLVGVASFGLGRLSALEEARPPVAIRQTPSAVSARAIPLGGQYVAARGGSVYYFPWCSGAQKIAPASQVWFASEKEAQASERRPAKNCKGLAEELRSAQTRQ